MSDGPVDLRKVAMRVASLPDAGTPYYEDDPGKAARENALREVRQRLETLRAELELYGTPFNPPWDLFYNMDGKEGPARPGPGLGGGREWVAEDIRREIERARRQERSLARR